MINFYHQVPSVYNNASRDFQFLSWLINVVLNSVKHNVDDLYDLPNPKADPRLIELLAMTLGFKVKRNYNKEQLTTIVSILPSILRYKGTLTAVELAGKALIKASGAVGVFESNLVDNCLEVQLPENLVDTVLFTDLLPYILPAGISVKIITKTEVAVDGIKTKLGHLDVPRAAWVPDIDWRNNEATGTATLFEDGKTPGFTNFNGTDANIGLLDNRVIPAVLESGGRPITNTISDEEEN